MNGSSATTYAECWSRWNRTKGCAKRCMVCCKENRDCQRTAFTACERQACLSAIRRKTLDHAACFMRIFCAVTCIESANANLLSQTLINIGIELSFAYDSSK